MNKKNQKKTIVLANSQYFPTLKPLCFYALPYCCIGEIEKFGRFFNFQKIITRKILIVGKNFTYKKSLRISFSFEKKIKKEGVQMGREGPSWGLRKISVFFSNL